MNSQDLLTVLLLIVTFITFFILLGYSIKLKHRQKMELIKKGDIMFENTSMMENMKYSSLSHGILLIALSIGLITSYYITGSISVKNQFIIYIAICSLSIGIGSLTFYFITKKGH
ncbi:DUF6249 domain-containing protein [Pedobacter sp. MR2016-19]|uniref:DUF6249 domain-containing protein n=1 Tax=Pedobacter sp. MR2016-19 TaxID=2780089 RepID=UPI00351D8EAB